MSSNSSSILDTASVTDIFTNFKSIIPYKVSTLFYAANKNEFRFQLSIYPRPQLSSKDVIIRLFHEATCEQLNFDYEVSILNARNEKCYTKNYQCNYDPNYTNNVHFGNFILYDELINEANGFLQNDALTLFCEVKILKASKILEQNLTLPKMSKDFQSAITTGDHCDFVLTVGDKKFKVHKAILAARSSVFKAMLSADLEEKKKNRMEMVDEDVNVFEQLLSYIYSGTVDKLDEYALELFSAADKYQLEELKSICAHSLSSTLTVDTVANILLFADMHGAPDLKVKCIKFITANSIKVMATDGWEQMVKTRLDLMAELYKDIARAHSACKL